MRTKRRKKKNDCQKQGRFQVSPAIIHLHWFLSFFGGLNFTTTSLGRLYRNLPKTHVRPSRLMAAAHIFDRQGLHGNHAVSTHGNFWRSPEPSQCCWVGSQDKWLVGPNSELYSFRTSGSPSSITLRSKRMATKKNKNHMYTV